MRLRSAILAVVAGLTVASVAPAGDFDKYLPPDSQFYVQVKVPKLFSSELVRTIVPMAFEKYGDQIVGLAGMAKNFNPNAPDIPEDQMKDAMKQMANPKVIAEAFDKAKNIVSDIVVAGREVDGQPDLVVLVKCDLINAEAVDGIASMMGILPGVSDQMKVEKNKKDKGTVYGLTMVQAGDQKLYITVPEKGILFMSMNNKAAEGSFAPTGKAGDKLAALMAKKATNDFIFMAGLGKEDDDHAAMTMNIVLDKDITSNVNMTYRDAAKAAEQAKEINGKFAEMVEQLKGMLGEKAEALKPSIAKSKATVDGKNVSATMNIPGAAVEKLLAKD